MADRKQVAGWSSGISAAGHKANSSVILCLCGAALGPLVERR